jgi:hypothetical protein
MAHGKTITEKIIMTEDLMLVADRSSQNRKVGTGVFINAVADHLQGKLYA